MTKIIFRSTDKKIIVDIPVWKVCPPSCLSINSDNDWVRELIKEKSLYFRPLIGKKRHAYLRLSSGLILELNFGDRLRLNHRGFVVLNGKILTSSTRRES